MGMRVQLQQQSGGRTIHHDSTVLDGGQTGNVTTAELIDALRLLRTNPAIPSREHGRADAALAKAIRWAASRPPNGVSGRFSKSFYFDVQHPGESFRFDIEGLSGSHLQV